MRMYEIGEWTLKQEDDLWLVYPTEEGIHSCNFRYFSSEEEAIEFAETYSAETEV